MTKEKCKWKTKNTTPKLQQPNGILDKLNIKMDKDLTEIYIKSDVALLADVFENFSKTCIKERKNSPLYCVFLPRYTWVAVLRFTQV